MIVQRELETAIKGVMNMYPIIALTGPRQSGKTTFLKNAFPDYQYVNLEDHDIRSFAENDPRAFFKQFSKYVIFDEVQRAPHLFSYIQVIVDESGVMGQFILSGSQNFHLMQNITQSLAGRVAIFKLLPFDFQELRASDLLRDDYSSHILQGGYPAIFDRNIPPHTFYPNYIETYVQRDLTELIAVQNMSLFKKFLSLCAGRAGQVLNLSSIANECGISSPTAKAWLSALESSYIVFLLQPYYKNFNKRVIKSPKLYFYDTGLLCSLLKINNISQFETQPIKGALFENMMVSEYVKRLHHKGEMQADVWYWRNSEGNEVDLLIQKPMHNEVVEIKATETIMPDLFKGLNYFYNLANDEFLKRTLVYGGLDNQQRMVADVVSWRDFGK